MTFPHILVILSALISVGGSIAYIRDTLKGTTKPNRASWSMWALAPLLGTGAALSAGADPWTVVRIFLAGFLPLIVFLISFVNRKSYWKLSHFDIVCGAFSAGGILAWAFWQSPRMAILFAAMGDGFASLPTILKAWKYPETETGTTYIAGLIAVLLVIPSIPTWDIENASFQIYLLITNSCLTLIVYRKRFNDALRGWFGAK